MTKRPKKKSKFLVAISFALTLLFTLTVADFCSNLIAIKTFSSTSSSSGQSAYAIYGVALGSYANKTSALEQSAVLQKQGGAGFVWESKNKFFVIASAYAEENDARLVKENLEKENFVPEIVKIEIGAITISGNYTTAEQNALVGAVTIYKTVFDNLYDISVALDTKVSSEAQSLLFVADVENLVSKTKLNFEAQFDAKLSTEVLYIKLSLADLYKKMETLKNFAATPAQTFSSKLKQTYMETIELNYNLCKSL